MIEIWMHLLQRSGEIIRYISSSIWCIFYCVVNMRYSLTKLLIFKISQLWNVCPNSLMGCVLECKASVLRSIYSSDELIRMRCMNRHHGQCPSTIPKWALWNGEVSYSWLFKLSLNILCRHSKGYTLFFFYPYFTF